MKLTRIIKNDTGFLRELHVFTKGADKPELNKKWIHSHPLTPEYKFNNNKTTLRALNTCVRAP